MAFRLPCEKIPLCLYETIDVPKAACIVKPELPSARHAHARALRGSMIACMVHMGPVIMVCLLVGCLTSQQQASVSQGRICSDSFTCCHTEIEVADQTFYLTQSQYTDTRPTSPSADPITPGAWQGSHWNAIF